MADQLFDLIKSLNKNEKGYFKKYVAHVSTKKENNYTVLFNILDKMKVYDKERLLQLLDGYSFVHFLSRQKNYLYQLILKNIHSYYLKNDAEVKLNDYFSSIKILYDKGLPNQCEKLIRKAKKIIELNSLNDHRMVLNRWENKLGLSKKNVVMIKDRRVRYKKGNPVIFKKKSPLKTVKHSK